jgi:cobalt-zinc-cadmium efflux system membrane fusion protein
LRPRPRRPASSASATALTATVPGAEPIAAVITAIAPVNEATGWSSSAPAPAGALPAVGTVVSARLASSDRRIGCPDGAAGAVQSVEGVPSVFVFTGEGFRATPGCDRRDLGMDRIEIVSGLDGDERIAGANAFLLKAELGRGASAERPAH